jgi:hypothetical protein
MDDWTDELNGGSMDELNGGSMDGSKESVDSWVAESMV